MQTLFETIQVVDLRPHLNPPLPEAPYNNKPQGKRERTTCVVLHYNGPPAPARAGGSMEEIIRWIDDDIRPNHIGRIGADGVQYHLWISTDGTLYQLRDLDDLLWHCGNGKGNEEGLALHIPIGGAQEPNIQQTTTMQQVFYAAIRWYQLSGPDAVFGHRELGASECPGTNLMRCLKFWRTSGDRSSRHRVIAGIDFAQVREEPRITAPEATIKGNSVRLVPGWIVNIDAQQGAWKHIDAPAPWGWIHQSLLTQVEASAPLGPPDERREPIPPPAQDDLIFVHPPRISRDFFQQILLDAHSPAYSAAHGMYDACAEAEVDPALLLAFFCHESSYGKAGLCERYNLKNPGNVRTPMNPARGVSLSIPGRGQFFQFRTWEEGAADWGERMRDKYTVSLELPTVRLATPIYAPVSDGNAPDYYAEKVIRLVRGWQQLEAE